MLVTFFIALGLTHKKSGKKGGGGARAGPVGVPLYLWEQEPITCLMISKVT